MISRKSQKIKQALVSYKNAIPPAKTVEEARTRMDIFGNRDKGALESMIEPVQNEKIRGEWLRCGEADPGKAILYLHGGAFITGSSQSARRLALHIAKAAQCQVFTLEYRLAPEYPFPAALEDTVAAYQWLLGQGILPEGLLLAGESAGGGLAVSAMLALREARLKLPAGAVLITPWADLSVGEEERSLKADRDPWYHPDAIESKAAGLYAGERDVCDPLISPVYADLSALPPILIQTAGDDVLYEDSLKLYDRGKKAGVDMHMELWEGIWRVWRQFAAKSPEAEEAVSEIGEFSKYQLKIGCATRFCTSDNNAFP
ncbi:MAG: alpha/beta hydrolase [Peptococcaceae bacterium]|jgi:acetyl esterase/lipase|nr:alpha/beta hydrolase [Peptococcaceae bacterium]